MEIHPYLLSRKKRIAKNGMESFYKLNRTKTVPTVLLYSVETGDEEVNRIGERKKDKEKKEEL